jgi:protein phosphatase 1 regulatory subunit 16A
LQHAAATCGHLHLVKFLIDAGAELLSVNADGNMPYDLCEDDTTLSYIENEMARRGVTQDLIDDTRSETERRMFADLATLQTSGGDLEIRDATGATPLHVASANGYLSVVEFLLDHHVSTEVVDNDQWQPLHAASCWGHLEVVEMLAQNGANISAKTRNGETPFDICEDPDIKERLLQLKEQRMQLGQPRVRRTRSASTRTQSIRRTSLREKMNTTKRDVQDEKLYFIQSIDGQKVCTAIKAYMAPHNLLNLRPPPPR